MAAQFQPAIVSYGKNSCIMVEGRENTGRFYIMGKIVVPNTEDVFRRAAYYKRGNKAVL